MTHPTTAQQEDLQNLPQQQQLQNPPQQENIQNIPHLFVANYPYQNTAEQFKALFSRLGQVSDAHLVQSKRDRHKGFGFVSYVDPQVAHLAVSNFDKMDVDQDWVPFFNQMVVLSTPRSLRVRLTDEFKRQNVRPHNQRDEQRYIPQVNQVVPQQQQLQQQFERNTENHHLFTVYFHNVPYVITYQQLARFFSKVGGPISKLRLIPHHQPGQHKGCGWVTFLERQSADDCYYYLRNSTARIMGRKIYVERAKPLRAARV